MTASSIWKFLCRDNKLIILNLQFAHVINDVSKTSSNGTLSFMKYMGVIISRYASRCINKDLYQRHHHLLHGKRGRLLKTLNSN